MGLHFPKNMVSTLAYFVSWKVNSRVLWLKLSSKLSKWVFWPSSLQASLIFLQEFFSCANTIKKRSSSAPSNEILHCNVGLHLPLPAKALFFPPRNYANMYFWVFAESGDWLILQTEIVTRNLVEDFNSCFQTNAKTCKLFLERILSFIKRNMKLGMPDSHSSVGICFLQCSQLLEAQNSQFWSDL